MEREVNAKREHIGAIDELRGLAIFLMVISHTVYDLIFMFGFDIPLFFSPFIEALQLIFAMVFIVISGFSCRLSRSNTRRGVRCLMFALLISYVTMLVLPDAQILFGILHLLGIGMLLVGASKNVLDRVPAVLGFIICIVLFVVTYGVEYGCLGIPGIFSFPLPSQLYGAFPLSFIVGLPELSFYSADYYPIFPWLFLFLAGFYIGRSVETGRFPKFLYKTRVAPLAFMGRHCMAIYVLHQPVIAALLYIVMKLIGRV